MLLGCVESGPHQEGLSGGDGSLGTTTGGGASGPHEEVSTASGTLDDDGDGSGWPGGVFDVGAGFDLGAPADRCAVVDDMNAVGACEAAAPPDSFEPVVQWSFTPDGIGTRSNVTPLVANFTDDNGDGRIDLCDTPDVVLIAGVAPVGVGNQVYILDGATGAPHRRFLDDVAGSVTPAVGDIDADGIVELVTLTPRGAFVAFDHDGTKKWERDVEWGLDDYQQSHAWVASLALADLDNDGDVEIIASNHVVDHRGESVLTLPEASGNWSATVPADLDGDGDLEIVLGNSAYHHDGALLWSTGLSRGYPQIADFDDDGRPEVLLTSVDGLALIEHDGAIAYSHRRPTGTPVEGTFWLRPATVHDFDGDGHPEFAVSSADDYAVYTADASVVWQVAVDDLSGVSGGTAFDFLGDGIAEAMYTDEQRLYVFGEGGEVLLDMPRSSGTLTEYPVVADVDNDGSAEILFVSMSDAPTLQVVADAEDRWIQARRIWNQHAYHVTNVREDGSIPRFEPPSWASHNTFRTNAQIEGGALCIPPAPAG